ncbi:MAG: YfhO family protein, partial [Ilumatobacteraceae bacterium]
DRAPSEWVPDWNGPIAEDARYSVWENPFWNGDSVAWFAARPPVAGLADILRTEYSSVSATAFADIDLNCTEYCQPTRLDSTRITAEHLVITAEVDRPALVVANVQAFKGWQATVNGLPVDALVVDGIFIGVAVDAGNHIIELRYQPAWWWPAVIVAISALVIAMVMVVRQRVTS